MEIDSCQSALPPSLTTCLPAPTGAPAGPCGHDFCLSCYYDVWVASNGGTAATSGARRGGSRAQCPLCRAPLPARPPAVCVRLRAAVEAAAGERVAARRAELAERHSQRRLAEALADAEEQRRLNRQLEQRLASFQRAAVTAAAAIEGADEEAAALHEENRQLRRTVAGLQVCRVHQHEHTLGGLVPSCNLGARAGCAGRACAVTMAART